MRVDHVFPYDGQFQDAAEARAEDRLLDLLVPPFEPLSWHPGDEEMARLSERRERTRWKFRQLLRDGKLERREVELDIRDPRRMADWVRSIRFDEFVRESLRTTFGTSDDGFLRRFERVARNSPDTVLRRAVRITVAEARRQLVAEEYAMLQVPQPIISPASTLVVPEPAQIVVVQKSLLKLLRGKPELLYEISHRQFEELVYELFAKLGYEVELTAQTRDGGADIIAFSQDRMGIRTKYVIEAKHYAPQRKIGVGVVRQVSSVRQKLGAHHGIIVTSSFFTADAARENREYYGLHLKDHDHLMDWIGQT